MPNLSKTTKFIIAVALQLAVILAIVIYKSIILSSGTEVLLQLQPVDPRDMLRGDYVNVSYQISRIYYYQNSYYLSGTYRTQNTNNANVIRNGDTVYVPLRKSGKFWITSGTVSKTKPNTNSGQFDCVGAGVGCTSPAGSPDVYIQGKVVSGGQDSNAAAYPNYGYNSTQLTIAYGIEDYYIPEGKGHDLSLWNSAGDDYARVAIGSNGKAVLKQLYINDKPWP